MTGTASAAEVDAMRRAVTLAALGLGRTGPNPVVGSVILDASGAVVGEGFHEQGPDPAVPGRHAEVVALAAAGERARGGTAVVTLEPCSHTGRTGPCTEALLAAGVRRVVYAVTDPNPPASGGGALLAAAGVEVESGVLAEEAEAVNEAWLHAVRTGRPFVTWKYAASLDGRVAAADGTPRWISGEESRAEVHALRAQVGAVVVGTGTALADDPELTVRTADGTPSDEQPLRVVVGSRSLPATARLHDTSVAETLFLDAGPAEVLAELDDRGIRSVLLEGGPTLAGAFLRAGLVDRVRAYLAPLLLGAGPAALTADLPTSSGAVRLRVERVSRVGADVRVDARPEYAEGAV